jgi:ABC-type lipoprotein export system ATPase subunit
MTENTEWLIETQNLTRIYGDGEQIYALNEVNLQVAHGELITVMGPSGSGKSTLLNMIGALDKPTHGKVIVDGQDLTKIRDKDKFRSQTVGFVFQLHNLIPTLTARENVEVPMFGQMGVRARRKRSKELLEIVGLPDRMKHLPSQLSGGQRQRVAVARALANNPPIVLADEPTGSLDTVAGMELMQLIKDLNATQGVTFLVVTHDLNVARQTRRVVVMADGRIVRQDWIGSPIEEDLKVWGHSGLGKRILRHDPDAIQKLGLNPEQVEAIHQLLSNNTQNEAAYQEIKSNP